MSYSGQVNVIQMGLMGLSSDLPHTSLPDAALTEAINIQLRNGFIEKIAGSKKFNKTALASGIVGMIEWNPDGLGERIVVVLRNGAVWQIKNNGQTNLEIKPSTGSGAPANLTVGDYVHILEAGKEAGSLPKKLFIFSGNDPIQIISDATPDERRDIYYPAVTWSDHPDFNGTFGDKISYPSFGIVYKSRLWCMGESVSPHEMVGSNVGNHEFFDVEDLPDLENPGDPDITSAISSNVVGPGRGKSIVTAFVYMGRLFVMKSPGMYYVDDGDETLSRRLNESFGAVSANASISARDDILIAGDTGAMLTSSATDVYGDIATSDLLTILGCEDYVKNNTLLDSVKRRSMVYYAGKKQVYVTYGKKTTSINDLIMVIDVSGQSPRISFIDKDQPNILGLRTDSRGLLIPCYGSDDGFIYDMDQEDKQVNGSGYEGKFATPHMDFSQGDPIRADTVKNYEHLEVTFIPTGDWDLDIDVYIDGQFSETLKINLSGRKGTLDTLKLDSEQARLDGIVPFSIRKKLKGRGKRIGFVCKNSGYLQDFKIVRLSVYFQFAGQKAVR